MPGIQGMESTTGVNVAGRLMEVVADTMKEREDQTEKE
jgi:ribosomal protein S6--L-glutamate ligase